MKRAASCETALPCYDRDLIHRDSSTVTLSLSKAPETPRFFDSVLATALDAIQRVEND